MNIKITFDPDGAYGYPKDGIIDGKQLVNDYIDTLNEVEDADTISFLKSSEIEKAVDFVAEMWSLNYDIIPDDKVILQTNKIRSRDVRITFTAEIFLSGTEDEIREQFRNMEFFSEKAIKNKADFVSLVSAEDVITNEEITIY